MDERWYERAVCRGEQLSVFFPTDDMSIHRWDVAFSYCTRCPVHKECLVDALKVEAIDDKAGMFGGYTPRERLMIRKGQPVPVKDFQHG
jgi:hypothetical protein